MSFSEHWDALLLDDGASVAAGRVVQFQSTTGSIPGSHCLIVKVSLSVHWDAEPQVARDEQAAPRLTCQRSGQLPVLTASHCYCATVNGKQCWSALSSGKHFMSAVHWPFTVTLLKFELLILVYAPSGKARDCCLEQNANLSEAHGFVSSVQFHSDYDFDLGNQSNHPRSNQKWKLKVGIWVVYFIDPFWMFLPGKLVSLSHKYSTVWTQGEPNTVAKIYKK